MRDAVVGDQGSYLCVGNIVVLLNPMRTFTDGVPKTKSVMRARNLYGGLCDGPSEKPAAGEAGGVLRLNYVVRVRGERRKVKIRRDRMLAGAPYPHERVRRASAEFDVVL